MKPWFNYLVLSLLCALGACNPKLVLFNGDWFDHLMLGAIALHLGIDALLKFLKLER